MLGRVRVSERENKMKESKCEKDCLCKPFFKRKMPASVEEPVALCECERTKQVRVCPHWPSQGHLLRLEIPMVSAFSHCSLSTLIP